MRIGLLRLFFSSVLTLSLSGFSANAASPQASVHIDQVSAGTPGSWILITGNGSTHASTDPGVNKKNYSLSFTDFGPTTLSITPPQGMSVRIGVYRGGELLQTVTVPQYSFQLFPNDHYRFVIQYSLDRQGSLGVTSTPSGVRFRMKGETTKTYSAVTPFTFKNIPAGRYSVTLSAIQGCLQPRAESAVVMPEERNTLNITLNCDQNQTSSGPDRVRPTKRSLMEYANQRELNERGNRK